jgi:hypothetical protein
MKHLEIMKAKRKNSNSPLKKRMEKLENMKSYEFMEK